MDKDGRRARLIIQSMPAATFAFVIFFAAWEAKKTPTLRGGKRQLCKSLYAIALTN